GLAPKEEAAPADQSGFDLSTRREGRLEGGLQADHDAAVVDLAVVVFVGVVVAQVGRQVRRQGVAQTDVPRVVVAVILDGLVADGARQGQLLGDRHGAVHFEVGRAAALARIFRRVVDGRAQGGRAEGARSGGLQFDVAVGARGQTLVLDVAV